MEENDRDLAEENKYSFNEIKKIKIYFFLNIKENIFILPIETDYFNLNNQCVDELIKNVVKKINDQKLIIKINSINYIISLQDIEDDEENSNFYINNYEIKPCKKKNHYPKNDSPNYSHTTLLKNIQTENISFISKNPLNILLREIDEENNDNNVRYQDDDDY